MAHLIRMPRATWRRQPQGVISANQGPFATGLLTLVSGSSLMDVAKNIVCISSTTTKSYSQGVSARIQTVGPNYVGTTAPQTILFYGALISSVGANPSFLFSRNWYWNTSADNAGFGIWLFYNSGANQLAGALWNNNNDVSLLTTQTIAVGEPFVAALTYNGTIATVYYNGNNIKSSLTTSGYKDVGGNFVSGYLDSKGSTTTLMSAGWDRCLSSAEIRAISENPWQLFSPAPARFILIPSAGGGSYNMTSVVASASSTATAAVNLLRAFQSTVASLSATSTPSLSNLISLLSPILSLSGTASGTLTILRTLDSVVNSLSSTNDAAIQIHRALQSAITGTSSTPDTVTLSVAGFIALLSTVASQSSVATPNSIIQRDMASAVASASSTSTAALQIQRDLLSSLNSTSATATVTLNTTTIIALASAVSSGSLTPNAACTIARALSSVVASTSSTADSAVDVQRNLLTSVASQSETSIALLEALNLIALAGAINSQSSTATPTLDVARALVSDVLSASVTATITPAVLRELATALVSASVTGDADLALAVLGQVELISSIASTSLTNDKARLLQDLVAAIQTEMTLTLSAERPSIQMTDTRPSIILH